jgi:hypothetical protein
MLRLGTNGTIDSAEEVRGEGGAVEEAVGGQKLQSSSSIIQTALPHNTLYLANMKTLFFPLLLLFF